MYGTDKPSTLVNDTRARAGECYEGTFLELIRWCNIGYAE